LGFAPEYVESMWLMLQQDKPDDYVISTGETHSVKEFAQKAFEVVGLDWQKYVVVDERFLRPLDVDRLEGDCTKARAKLGWEPRSSSISWWRSWSRRTSAVGRDAKKARPSRGMPRAIPAKPGY